MPTPTSDDVAAFLTRRWGARASSEQVAVSISAICRGAAEALTPILGAGGVAALYNRSVHLAGQTHTWMAAAKAGVPAAMDLAALTSLIERQTPTDAAAGGGLLLHTFYELLTSLIGPSLTERLLRSVWAPFLIGSSQDTLP
jgi:hypothetical protein